MTKILRLTAAALILAGMAGWKMDVTPELYVSRPACCCRRRDRVDHPGHARDRCRLEREL